MREKFYQMDELARARVLQDEAAKLHIPVPVLSYQYEIKDATGGVEEKGVGKSNSYTRNALNSIAWLAGLASTTIASSALFTDGIMSAKNHYLTGTILYPTELQRFYTRQPVVEIGISTDPESLDSYNIQSSGLTKISNTENSVFNVTTRKLISTITGTFKNNTASVINITESGVKQQYGSSISDFLLFIRDVFTAVPVEPGQTITWTYVTEVSYPEP